MGGLGGGRMITLAARPGVGKTTLAMNIAAHVASQGYKVGFYSLEMSAAELMERLIVSESQVDAFKIKQNLLTVEDIYQIAKSIFVMSKWNLSIDDTSSMSTFEVSTRAKREKAEHGLDLLIVDYLGLLNAPEGIESRVEQVSEITRRLKVLSRELHIPVITVSQLNRKVEEREGGEPRLADLRDSGSIEQDSDQVVFLWRDGDDNDYGKLAFTHCKVAKNRHGPTGEFQMALVKEQSRFVER